VNRKIILIVILGAALALRLSHFWFISQSAFPKITFYFSESDMHATWEWARTIVGGDLLGRDTYHPYFRWMKEIAPLETWYRFWGGKEIFQQAPLYAYWVAALAAASRSSINFIFFCQLILGVAQGWIMFLLGRRLFGETAGLIAAALTALYGPFVFYQATLLRDWLPPIIESAALLLMLRAAERGKWADWALAGAAAGAAVLTRESGVLLLPVALVWLLVERARFVKPAALLLAGFLVALSPLIVRNAIVGAPPLALSNRAAETLIEGNAAEASGAGVDTRPIGAILHGTDGRIASVIGAIVKGYRGNPRAALDKYASKLRAVLGAPEIPDNLSYDYGRETSPVLLFTISFGLLLTLGVVGVFLRPRARLLEIYGLISLAELMILPAVGRYRLVLAAVLILYAAAGASSLYQSWEPNTPRLWRIAIAAGAVFFLVYMVLPLPQTVGEADLSPLHNGVEYIAAINIYADEKRFDEAEAELQRYQNAARYAERRDLQTEAYVMLIKLYQEWAQWLQANGKIEQAQRRMRQAEFLNDQLTTPGGMP